MNVCALPEKCRATASILTCATVLADIQQRDYQDTHRAIAPLKQADDAILVDTSDIGFDESFELLKRTILAHI